MSGTLQKILEEVHQGHNLRRKLLATISEEREGRCVVSFFISFYSRVPLSSGDADMFEEILCNSDTTRGITLILDAPGGDPLAAERIIQLCRNYSKKDFEAIVPARAKSAATMVCLGADRILMGLTSELGPIDPQIPFNDGKETHWRPALDVIKTYDELMAAAVNLGKNKNIEPYLQQLQGFSAVDIEGYRAATKLSEHIAVRSLKQGMMKRLSFETIKKRIKWFTDRDVTYDHGRALTLDHLDRSGLKLQEVDLHSRLWHAVRDLHARSTYAVSRVDNSSKLIETIDDSYRA